MLTLTSLHSTDVQRAGGRSLPTGVYLGQRLVSSSGQRRVSQWRPQARRPRPVMARLIITAELNDLDPQAWLATCLAAATYQLDELLPWKRAVQNEIRSRLAPSCCGAVIL